MLSYLRRTMIPWSRSTIGDDSGRICQTNSPFGQGQHETPIGGQMRGFVRMFSACAQ
jgi:hypothetical protein